MLQNFLFPQPNEFEPQDLIWKQDGVPPHFLHNVRDWLNDIVLQRWIGRAGPNDMNYSRWPPRSSHLTPCDFFLWGCVKDSVYLPPLPVDLPHLRKRIVTAVESITPDMLNNVWKEFNSRLESRSSNKAGPHYLTMDAQWQREWRQSSRPMNVSVFLTLVLRGSLSSTCIDCASAYNIATCQERTPKYFIKLVCLSQASAVMYSMRSREYDVAGAASASPSLNASTYNAYWTFRGELS